MGAAGRFGRRGLRGSGLLSRSRLASDIVGHIHSRSDPASATVCARISASINSIPISSRPFATEFCGVKALRYATRDQVENFHDAPSRLAETDRTALFCQPPAVETRRWALGWCGCARWLFFFAEQCAAIRLSGFFCLIHRCSSRLLPEKPDLRLSGGEGVLPRGSAASGFRSLSRFPVAVSRRQWWDLRYRCSSIYPGRLRFPLLPTTFSGEEEMRSSPRFFGKPLKARPQLGTPRRSQCDLAISVRQMLPSAFYSVGVATSVASDK